MKAARYIGRTAIITVWLYYGMIPKQLVVLSVGFIPNIEYLTVNHWNITDLKHIEYEGE